MSNGETDDLDDAMGTEDLARLLEAKKSILAELEMKRSDMTEEQNDIDSSSSYDSSDAEQIAEQDTECVEDIDELLERPVEESANLPSHKKLAKRLKRVLEYRGTDHFDVLPDGWVEVTHASGLPVYLHKPSRVCTFGRPYFLGPGSVRRHRVPESAIPCYFQKKLLRENEEELENSVKIEEPAENVTQNGEKANGEQPSTSTNIPDKSNDGGEKSDRSEILNKLLAPAVKITTAKDILKTQLSPDELYEYARKAFKVKNICVYRFHKWTDARNFYKDKKRCANERMAMLGISKDTLRPTLPGDVKLITVPSFDHASKPQQRGFYLNPRGKTSVSILHEFVQKVLKCTVKYDHSETRSSATPYHCVARLVVMNNPKDKSLSAVSVKERLAYLKAKCYASQSDTKPDINGQNPNADSIQSTIQDGVEYITLGDGYGNSIKLAKLTAARKAVENLIPGRIEFAEDGTGVVKSESNEAESTPSDNLEIFDHLPMNDTRIPELCTRCNQPSPYLILQECLKRSATFGDTEISSSTRRLRHQQHLFELKVGKHTVHVHCSNKREGKQKAAQQMIAKLHPNEKTWGAILRLYGYEAQQKHKEARKNKESIIKLQGEVRNQNEKGRRNGLEQNPMILEKLRSEMFKLSEKLVEKAAESNPEAIASQLVAPPVMQPAPETTSNGDKNMDSTGPEKSAESSGSPPTKKRKKVKKMPQASENEPQPSNSSNSTSMSAKCPFTDSSLDPSLISQTKNRPDQLGFTHLPVLNEAQLREMSARLAKMFPEKFGLPMPCLEL
ncbi:microprocessor complex subunit DGCR8 [Ditylenchus destructor]|uniref:Microprocessor complex subunit DGCR8 n=1 Tax=Ditylenchus destructor TaxID=166010 RepID=A0AAD4QX66_9BILA|nr:microprocessor complex subunit DGCR8 [Ditylenchus destructor]